MSYKFKNQKDEFLRTVVKSIIKTTGSRRREEARRTG